jgi:acetolactate synthase-1/2/3 large subunit
MRVADYILSALRDQGVDHCFIDLGGLNDNFMPALTGTKGLRTIVAAFEGGAAYMADGYARASGGLGVCFGIGGPGILNMTTALAAARADRSPVLAISGEVARSWEGMGGFQDASGAGIDDIDVLRRVTELSLSLSSRAVVSHHLRHAITYAFTRRSPVHLSVPVDVQKAEIDSVWQPVPESLRSARFVDENALDRAVGLLNAAGHQKIIVLAGPGVLHAHGIDALCSFVERFDIPVATTLSGKGLIPESHPLALGVFGYGGSPWAIDAIRSNETDILLVIGSGLSQRDTMQWDPKMLPSKALIYIDADPLTIGRTWAGEVAVVANAGEALQRLAHIKVAAGLEAGRAEARPRAEPIPAGGHQERRHTHAPRAGRGRVASRLSRQRRAVRGLGRAPRLVCRVLGCPRVGYPLFADQPRPDGRGGPARHRRKARPARPTADGRHGGRLHADAWHGAAHGGAREGPARYRADEQPVLR